MAVTALVPYVWQQGDTRWRVAGRQMLLAGYTDSPSLAEDIAAYNHPDNVLPGQRGYIDWSVGAIPVNTVIVIPHQT